VTTRTSKSILPFAISSISSVEPTISAPLSFASNIFSPFAITATLTFLPVPCGRGIAPLTF